MDDVAEKYGERGKDASDTTAKYQQQEQRNRNEQDRPVERRACKDHDDQHRAKTEQHIHKAGNDPGNGENILWNVNFFDEACVSYHGRHCHGGGFVEKVVDDLTRDQIKRVVFDVIAENVRKCGSHDQHHE